MTCCCLGVDGLVEALSGYVGGVWVPFKKLDACTSIGSCPLKADESVTYSLSLSISNEYPKVSELLSNNCYLMFIV